MTRPATPNLLVSMSGALMVLFRAIIGAYRAIDNRVVQIAATAVTTAQVEHIIDLKTVAQLDAIDHRLERIEGTLLRLQDSLGVARVLKSEVK